jgi:hypothetical protein
MKRPGPIVWLFGNPASVILLVIAAIYFIYQWSSNHGAGAAALIAFIAAGYGAGASDQLLKYQQWKREWAAMEGKASGAAFAKLYPVVRVVFASAVWCLFGYLALQPSSDPAMHVAVALFWLATLVMIVGGIANLIRRRKPRKQTIRDVPVTVCLSVPHRSPTLAQAFAALPNYCRPLFADRANQRAPIVH